MNLSQNSWHYKLHQLTYMPSMRLDNFCPYFWRLLLAGLLLVPNFLFTLPSKIILMIDDTVGDMNWKENRAYFSPLMGMSFIVNFFLFLLVGMVWVFFDFNSLMGSFGVLGWLVAIIAAIAGTIGYIREKRREARRSKGIVSWTEKPPNIFVEFIKAKYKKHCPIINWTK